MKAFANNLLLRIEKKKKTTGFGGKGDNDMHGEYSGEKGCCF